MKAYLMLGAILAGILAGWYSRSWYEDSRKVDALETVIELSNKRVVKDEKIISDSIVRIENVKRKFKNIKANPASSDCIISGDTIRVWNQASEAANKAGTR